MIGMILSSDLFLAKNLIKSQFNNDIYLEVDHVAGQVDRQGLQQHWWLPAAASDDSYQVVVVAENKTDIIFLDLSKDSQTFISTSIEAIVLYLEGKFRGKRG